MISTCTACGLVFESEKGFDRHRHGNYDKGQRRCYTIGQLRQRGYTQNKHGRWVTEAMSPEAVVTRQS